MSLADLVKLPREEVPTSNCSMDRIHKLMSTLADCVGEAGRHCIKRSRWVHSSARWIWRWGFARCWQRCRLYGAAVQAPAQITLESNNKQGCSIPDAYLAILGSVSSWSKFP